MNLTEKIMMYKHFAPTQKLLLIVISNYECTVPNFAEPCKLTSQEMADSLGLTRTKVQDDLWDLMENDLIETKVENKMRYTSLTKRCINLIKKKS